MTPVPIKIPMLGLDANRALRPEVGGNARRTNRLRLRLPR